MSRDSSASIHIPTAAERPTISVREAARIIGTSASHLYGHIECVPHVKIGNRVRVITGEFREMLGFDAGYPDRSEGAA